MRLRAINILWRAFALSYFFLSFFLSVAFAEISPDEVELRYHYYNDSTGLSVVSPSITVKKNITERTLIFLKSTDETYEFKPKGTTSSGASGGGEHDHGKTGFEKTFFALDAVSGASAIARSGGNNGFKEVRKEILVGAKYQWDNTVFGGAYAYSDEEDYQSNALALSVSRDFFQKNTNLYFDVSHSQDEVDNLNKGAEKGWPKDKETKGLTLVLTQLLSPKSFVRVGYGIDDVAGYLSSPYRKIRISATDFDEVHPDTRLRQTLFLWYNRYFETRSSTHLSGSYYRDDWGVDAYSAEVKLYQYLSDALIFRLRYRHYRQTNADFFDPNRTAPSAIMSADHKLRSFDSDLYGLKFVYRLIDRPIHALEQIDLELGYDRLQEPNDFKADLSMFVFRMVF